MDEPIFYSAQILQGTDFYLGCHDKLMVNDVVRGVSHTKQGAGRMEVTWHACPHIHIFTNALGANTHAHK